MLETFRTGSAMSGLSHLIHQSMRTHILRALAALEPEDSLDAADLKTRLRCSDASLAKHLATLKELGYLTRETAFADRKVRTLLRATALGRALAQGSR